MKKTLKNNSGQTIIIVLLAIAVGLTIGLAVISRSVTSIRISRQEEESARAFSEVF
jgi:Tfp pilus assembly protein PilX